MLMPPLLQLEPHWSCWRKSLQPPLIKTETVSHTAKLLSNDLNFDLGRFKKSGLFFSVLTFYWFFMNFTSCTPIPFISLSSYPVSALATPPTTEKKISFCGSCSVSQCLILYPLATPFCLQMFIAMTCWSGTRLLHYPQVFSSAPLHCAHILPFLSLPSFHHLFAHLMAPGASGYLPSVTEQGCLRHALPQPLCL